MSFFYAPPKKATLTHAVQEHTFDPNAYTRWESRRAVLALMESGKTELEALSEHLATLTEQMAQSTVGIKESVGNYTLLRKQERAHAYTERRLLSIQEHIGQMAPQYMTEDVETYTTNWGMDRTERNAIDFETNMMDFLLRENTTVEEDIDLVRNMILLESDYSYETARVLESKVLNAVHGAAKSGEQASRKASIGARKAGRQIRRVKTTASKIPGHFDNLINSTFGALKRMDENERKRRILEGTLRFKLYRIIRNAALIGTGFAVAPALTAIGILVQTIRRKGLDERARAKLVHELEAELRIVKEKVKDADSKGDDKKKYQLMRIENRIESDLQRVKYRNKGERNNTTMTKHINT